MLKITGNRVVTKTSDWGALSPIRQIIEWDDAAVGFTEALLSRVISGITTFHGFVTTYTPGYFPSTLALIKLSILRKYFLRAISTGGAEMNTTLFFLFKALKYGVEGEKSYRMKEGLKL